jgi:hypothetical protein
VSVADSTEYYARCIADMAVDRRITISAYDEVDDLAQRVKDATWAAWFIAVGMKDMEGAEGERD